MMEKQSIIKKTFLTATFSLVAMFGYGQNDEVGDKIYLHTKSSGEAAVYSMEEINKITFKNNSVQIWNTNWPTDYVYSNFRIITLSTGGTGILGDINGDGLINVADVVEITNYIKGSPTAKFNFDRADSNSDGKVDGTDRNAVRKRALRK